MPKDPEVLAGQCDVAVMGWQLTGHFTYLIPADVKVSAGQRVCVPFGKRLVLGITLPKASQTFSPNAKVGELKSLEKVLENRPILDRVSAEFLRFAAEYYRIPYDPLLRSTIPMPLLKLSKSLTCTPWEDASDDADNDNLKTKKTPQDIKSIASNVNQIADLTKEQEACVSALAERAHGFSQTLLDGVTGSGKTRVYIEAIRSIVVGGGQVLYLVPEIGLTAAAAAAVKSQLGVSPTVIHSRQLNKTDNWLRLRNCQSQVVVGTRSALFPPLPNLQYIVVDEEHDQSYNPSGKDAYTGRNLAIKKAQLADCPVLLGSATPSLESLYRVNQGQCLHLKMRKRAVSGKMAALLPSDNKNARKSGRLLSPQALSAMRATLAGGKQVLLFWDLRGYARSLSCNHCGWLAECNACDRALVHHFTSNLLACHLCGQKHLSVPSTCPECGTSLHSKRSGTEWVEEWCGKEFPEYPSIRIDRDTTARRGQFDTLVKQAERQTPAILIGTQMIAKGHNFLHLDLGIILHTDSQLHNPEVRGLEKWAQLMLQVTGRVGRGLPEEGAEPSKVMFETSYPKHHLINAITRLDYETFAAQLLRQRQTLNQPPYAHVMSIQSEATDADLAMRTLATLAAHLKREQQKIPDVVTAHGLNTKVIGPFPGFPEKVKHNYFFCLYIVGENRADIRCWIPVIENAMRQGPRRSGLKMRLKVDPQSGL